MISVKGIEVDPAKVAAVRWGPTPKNTTEI